MKIVRDRNGWTSIVIAESPDGVVVDWRYVDPVHPLRFIPNGEYEIVSESDVFLQEEKNIEHECNDPRMINWCVRNLIESDFEYKRGTGFGCSCEDEYGYSVYQDKDGMLIAGVCSIHPEHPKWEDWMYEFNEHEIRVYYCPRCREWAIDNDF